MSLAKKLGRPATLADIEALPPDMKGEILDGELYVMPRPRSRHSNIALGAGGEIQRAYQHGKGGPAGWWILVEPGVELPGSPEVAPDLAGWRRERLPSLPVDEPIRVVPDWVCEIHSPTTRGYDQLKKRPFYARAGVAFLWFIDPEARSLFAYQLVDGRWSELGAFGDDEKVRCAPFDAVELDLAEWWAAGPA